MSQAEQLAYVAQNWHKLGDGFRNGLMMALVAEVIDHDASKKKRKAKGRSKRRG